MYLDIASECHSRRRDADLYAEQKSAGRECLQVVLLKRHLITTSIAGPRSSSRPGSFVVRGSGKAWRAGRHIKAVRVDGHRRQM